MNMKNDIEGSWVSRIQHRVTLCLLDANKQAKGLERQFSKKEYKKDQTTICKPPRSIHTLFDSSDVQPWDPVRFAMVKDLQDAPGNSAKVYLMWDREEDRHVACKRLPNAWMKSSHSEFTKSFPGSPECPWVDLGFQNFLASVGFPYGCSLKGVYRGDDYTDVITSYASEGDLFSWTAELGMHLGPSREALVRPLVVQLLDCVRRLHDLSIVHRDISMENVLLTKLDGDNSQLNVRIIDFGMASTQRHSSDCWIGKPSYRAPELHNCKANTMDFSLTPFL
jgi:serine/threonine protein kinase